MEKQEKAENKIIKNTELRTRYFIGKSVELTEAQAKAHIKKQEQKK